MPEELRANHLGKIQENPATTHLQRQFCRENDAKSQQHYLDLLKKCSPKWSFNGDLPWQKVKKSA